MFHPLDVDDRINVMNVQQNVESLKTTPTENSVPAYLKKPKGTNSPPSSKHGLFEMSKMRVAVDFFDLSHIRNPIQIMSAQCQSAKLNIFMFLSKKPTNQKSSEVKKNLRNLIMEQKYG